MGAAERSIALPNSDRSRSDHLTAARAVALDAIAGVVAGHVNYELVSRLQAHPRPSSFRSMADTTILPTSLRIGW